MPKNAVRQTLLAQRRTLSAPMAQAMSRTAQERMLALPVFQQARVLALYVATHNEVETGLLCAEAMAMGKTVLYPAVVGHTLEFRQYECGQTLVRGGFGIGEPPVGSPVWQPEQMDLIVVPGVAFDRQGQRIGYGKGYYDRVLHALEGSGRLWGLCYDFQLIDEVVHMPHDALMDGVVTEHRVIGPCD
jgi:5-formyltetrahydrofolate cyclo-ligase